MYVCGSIRSHSHKIRSSDTFANGSIAFVGSNLQKLHNNMNHGVETPKTFIQFQIIDDTHKPVNSLYKQKTTINDEIRIQCLHFAAKFSRVRIN